MTMTRCVDAEILERFAAGTASRSECRAVVRHLLARCGTCAGRLRSMTARPSIDEGAYDGALARLNAMAARLPPQVARGGPVQIT